MELKKAYVLLSGGIDSTTCLYSAVREFGFENVAALSINYGQRHSKELVMAGESCATLKVPHIVKDISQIMSKTMLTDPTKDLPNASYDDLPKGISPTYVPFRNGLMLSLLASFIQGEIQAEEQAEADRLGTDEMEVREWLPEVYLYYGAHAEDAQNWAYPDCTPEFNGAMANAIFIGTYQKVRLVTPLQWMKKWQIVQEGARLKVNWDHTWSCYAGGDLHCGTCPTCRARHQAFIDASLFDPTTYAKKVSNDQFS